MKVKGKRQPIAIYELLGKGPPDPELARFLELYHQGLKLFRERQWVESLAALEAARELHPQDGHLARYLDLAKKFKQRPPDPEWDGVAVMERK